MMDATNAQLSDAQFEQLRTHYQTIVERCKVCGGTSRIDAGVCACQQTYEWVRALVIARIPQHYWLFDFTSIAVSQSLIAQIKAYTKNIIVSTAGLLLCGDSGVGKTTIACIIGRSMLLKGFTVMFTTAHEINVTANAIKCGDADADALDILFGSDLIIIDEFDKIVFTESAKVNLLLALKTHLNKRFIITTNFSEDEIIEQYGSAMMSFLKRHAIITPILGTDHSDKAQKRLHEVGKQIVLDSEVTQYQKIQAQIKKQKYDEVL